MLLIHLLQSNQEGLILRLQTYCREQIIDKLYERSNEPARKATTEDEIEETGYTKSVLFVRQDNYVVIRAVNWLKKGGRLKYLDVKKLEEIDGIWVPTEVHMTLKKGKTTLHKTVLRAHNVKFNQDLAPDHFTLRKLEAGH